MLADDALASRTSGFAVERSRRAATGAASSWALETSASAARFPVFDLFDAFEPLTF
jgi:hypothetical protein